MIHRSLFLVLIAVALAGCSLVDELLPRPVMSRDQAIAAAQAAAPDWADKGVIAAELGPWEKFSPTGAVEGPRPNPSDLVWVVNLGWQIGPLNGQGMVVILDARDGHVIQRQEWIS